MSLFNKKYTKKKLHIKNIHIKENIENTENEKDIKENEAKLTEYIEAFTRVYETHIWGDNNDPTYQGSSGVGSDIRYNSKTYVPFLRNFIKKYKIKSVDDLGCGDFRIGLLIYNDLNVNYLGYDAYKKVIDHNLDRFKDYGGAYRFIHSDFSSIHDRHNIEPADLCIIKDVIQHWPTANIISFMDYIIASKKFKYILICNCYKGDQPGRQNDASYRRDIKPGEFSSLSIKHYPLNKYNGEILYTWDTKEVFLITIKNADSDADSDSDRDSSDDSDDSASGKGKGKGKDKEKDKEKEKDKSKGKEEIYKHNKAIRHSRASTDFKSIHMNEPNKIYFTSRIILNTNSGRPYNDMITLKKVLESIGGVVEIVYFEMLDLKNNKNKTISTNVNIQIFIEHTFALNAKSIFPANKSYIFINQENINDWDLLNLHDKTVAPLCKSRYALSQLKNLGFDNAKYVGFGNETANEFRNMSDDHKIPNLFLHISGSSPLKGTKLIIDTWINKKIKAPLIITAYNKSLGNENLFSYWRNFNPNTGNSVSLPEYILKIWPRGLPIPKFENSGSIFFCRTELDSKVIKFLQNIADINLCPSIIEEWGQNIDEARQAKSLILTLNAPPMNELLDNTCSILIKAEEGPELQDIVPYEWSKYFAKNNTYKTYESTLMDFYNGIKNILGMSFEERRAMGEIAFHKSQIDYFMFKKSFTNIIKNDTLDIKKDLQKLQQLYKQYHKTPLGVPLQIPSQIAPHLKCPYELKISIVKKNINKINHECNTLYINPIYLKKNEKQIIISEYMPSDNYLDIFIKEIFNIWLYTESYFPGQHKLSDKNDIIIVLKHFTNSEANRLRLNMLKVLYRNVFIKSFNTNSLEYKKYSYKIITLENNSRVFNFENLMKKNVWIANMPGQNPYLKSLIQIAKKSLGIYNYNYNHSSGTPKIGFLYRSNGKYVYDIKDKEKGVPDKKQVHLHIKDKLMSISLGNYFEAYDVEHKSIEDIANFVKDKQILISPYWHDLTHLFLLPNNATIIELTYSKHWYCDPVCEEHLSGKKAYGEDCGNRYSTYGNRYSSRGNVSDNELNPYYNIENSELYYYKAEYHNLSILCCKNWIEMPIDYGKDYRQYNGKYNNAYINELYINTDKLVEIIKENYKK